MSDSKRTGGRDISELKQRLGLRKGASQTGSQTRAPGSPSGGVVPPPGLNLPPPPGLQQSAGPAIPNAADDPFGAMNAMAQVGTYQRAPEIVIVNDGKPVENVSGGSRAIQIAKFAVPAVVALALGVFVGGRAKEANFYNQGLAGTRGIGGAVKDVKKTVSELETTLEDVKGTFRPDKKFDETTLAELSKKLDAQLSAAQMTKIFAAKEASGNDLLMSQLLGFYAGADEVKSMLDDHIKAALNDDVMVGPGQAKADAANLKDGEVPQMQVSRLRYAIVVSAPTDGDKAEFGARFVELGKPYCGDKKEPSDTGKCGENEPITAYAYRTDATSFLGKGDLVTAGADNIPAKKIVPLIANPVLDSVIKGTDVGATEALYNRRLKAIEERAKKLVDDGNKLETALQVEAGKSDRFSFFL